MTASADKVQYILETLLEESIPLVKRGIFSQVQLRQMMHRRQKCQNSMLKKQYKLTDYLSAIEYEYQLERQRKFRMDQVSKIEDGHINPLYKKQSSSDFAIVKRILRLWDRTMHKYKFKLHLWKQYLKFCITIGSKKHFYKALTNALRFMPFQLDLWKIGVQYEKEHGHNLWKARKILIKGLKMVPSGVKNVQLGKYMIRFQVQFLKGLLHRRSILIEGQQGMKFVGEQHEQHEQQLDKQDKSALDKIDLTEYDKILWLVIEEILRKNTNNEVQALSCKSLRNQLLNVIVELYVNSRIDEVKTTLNKVQTKLKEFTLEGTQIKVQPIEIEIYDNIKEQFEQTNQFDGLLIPNTDKINFKIAERIAKKYCLKPDSLNRLFQYMADINLDQTIQFLKKYRPSIKLPSSFTHFLLQNYLTNDNIQFKQKLMPYLQKQVNLLQASDLRNNSKLLKQAFKFNNVLGQYQNTVKMIRSLTILYKKEPEFLQFCNQLSNQN